MRPPGIPKPGSSRPLLRPGLVLPYVSPHRHSLLVDFRGAVWAGANKRLGAEKPNLEKEIEKVNAQAAKTQTAVNRYFEAFEAGTLQPELCNEKVRDLRERLEGLEAERRDLEARRERLELPAINRDMMASLVDNFEQVMAEAPNPQKKERLRRLVKKVVVYNRRTIEVW